MLAGVVAGIKINLYKINVTVIVIAYSPGASFDLTPNSRPIQIQYVNDVISWRKLFVFVESRYLANKGVARVASQDANARDHSQR